METLIQTCTTWLTTTHHKVLETKTASTHAVVLAESLRDTPGTADLPPTYLLVMVETEKSLATDFERRVQKAVDWTKQDPHRRLGLYLPEGQLINRQEFVIIRHYRP